MTDDSVIVLITAILAAITAYPSVRKGLVAINSDVEEMIRELKRRREG